MKTKLGGFIGGSIAGTAAFAVAQKKLKPLADIAISKYAPDAPKELFDAMSDGLNAIGSLSVMLAADYAGTKVGKKFVEKYIKE